jgi:hypothetical protein
LVQHGVKINYNDLSGTDKITYNLYGSKFSDITGGSFNISNAVSGLYVGEIMNFKGNVTDGWFKADGVTPISAIEDVIADISMAELLTGNVDFKAKINNLTLSDVVDVSSSKVLSLLADTKISQMATAVDGLYIGDLMGYEYNEDEDAWFNNGVKVTGLYGTLSKYTISSLTNGDLENMKIGDIIDTSASPILNLLSGESLSTVSQATNKLVLGDIMGYDYNESEDAWYDNGVKVAGLNGKIASYSIQDVSDGKIGGAEFVNSLTMGDIFSADDLNKGTFSLMYLGDINGVSYSSVSEVKITDISARTIKGIQEAKYYDLEQAGVSLLSDEDELKIKSYYASFLCPADRKPTDVVSDDGWKKEKTLSQVISDVINSNMMS